MIYNDYSYHPKLSKEEDYIMKIQKSIFPKLWILVLTGILILALTACSDGNAPATTEAVVPVSTEASLKITAPETQPPETEPVKEFYQMGETLTDGDFEITYLASGVYAYEDSKFFQPAEGNHWIFLTFRVTNLTSNSQILGMERFRCPVEPEDAYIPDNFSGCTIPTDQPVTIDVYFEVPVGTPKIEVEYISYSDSNKPPYYIEEVHKFLYEGEMDSGLSRTENPAPTPDAIHVGEAREFPDFNVTYLSSYLDNSISIPAKEGYHYVTCEIEYENLSSAALDIEVLCFADGLNCEKVTFQRKGNIIGNVPTGETATGVWTFAVPDGAAVVELEHIVRLAYAEGENSYTLDNNTTEIVFDASNPAE